MLKSFHLKASKSHQRLLDLAKTDGHRSVTDFFEEEPESLPFHARGNEWADDGLVQAAHFESHHGSAS